MKENLELYVPVFKVPADIHGGTKILVLNHCPTKEQADRVGEALGVDQWEFIGTFKLVKQD